MEEAEMFDLERELKDYEMPLDGREKFFTKVDDFWNTAWNRKFMQSFDGYADKYRDTVELLYEKLDDRLKKDKAAYPMMFLCRHCIELRLKSIIVELQKLKGEQENITGHNLCELWEKLDALYDLSSKDGVYSNAYHLISELHNYDRKSDAFRYPIHNNGTPVQIAEFVDLDVFYCTFRKLDIFLEGIQSEAQNALNVE
ncbi:MAG: hypothetical protein PUG15_02420 [Bacteroidales bacterium]|nr:hypothetical protein [Bacteroidales bacterium]